MWAHEPGPRGAGGALAAVAAGGHAARAGGAAAAVACAGLDARGGWPAGLALGPAPGWRAFAAGRGPGAGPGRGAGGCRPGGGALGPGLAGWAPAASALGAAGQCRAGGRPGALAVGAGAVGARQSPQLSPQPGAFQRHGDCGGRGPLPAPVRGLPRHDRQRPGAAGGPAGRVAPQLHRPLAVAPCRWGPAARRAPGGDHGRWPAQHARFCRTVDGGAELGAAAFSARPGGRPAAAAVGQLGHAGGPAGHGVALPRPALAAGARSAAPAGAPGRPGGCAGPAA